MMLCQFLLGTVQQFHIYRIRQRLSCFVSIPLRYGTTIDMMNIYFLVAIAMCQFLLGTVQRAERENIMKENNKCQFLLGTVQRNCK